MRLGSCSGKNFPIPGNITGTDEDISYTIGLAKDIKRTLHLWVNRDLSYVVEPDGKFTVDRKY